MVCLGNICRSPLAEGILKHKGREKEIALEVDSAGTSSWHKGELPDPRSIDVSKSRGIDISDQRSRPIIQEDFKIFDLILVMDNENYNNVLNLTTDKTLKKKVHRLLDYNPGSEVRQVPDPYWGGGFDYVFDLIDEACDCLCQNIQDGYLYPNIESEN